MTSLAFPLAQALPSPRALKRRFVRPRGRNPLFFGRGRFRTASPPRETFSVGDDVKLFASTFAGGFLFVSLLLA